MSLSQAWKWDPGPSSILRPLRSTESPLVLCVDIVDIVKEALLPVLFPSTSCVAPDLRQFGNRVFLFLFLHSFLLFS
jgi:hypothetical protein